MQNLFEIGDVVIVTGTATGLGDVQGTILQKNLASIDKQYYYLIITPNGNFYTIEKYIKKI